MTAAISQQRSDTISSRFTAGELNLLTALMSLSINNKPDPRALRIHREAEDKRLLDAIDEELGNTRAREKKRKANKNHILLLGESPALSCR